ncbi:hypothetical protein BCR33DRAFT_714469 [Rhizoclosmatium globosum]|uniref:Condensation domain-containing protein n=1 Tax=Rhizoclosmatium globosum TaxID=329046 RepID=A0A1Y2CP55_9FUNG|nr:hypothetical protein BCR33DRAFT_714469 [Rhizoclosmatium globosum]|eukprot:ORY48747.1 hypothetical protein BCR33DRAFT_714469 [Rhizoclosmatium globosum]
MFYNHSMPAVDPDGKKPRKSVAPTKSSTLKSNSTLGSNSTTSLNRASVATLPAEKRSSVLATQKAKDKDASIASLGGYVNYLPTKPSNPVPLKKPVKTNSSVSLSASSKNVEKKKPTVKKALAQEKRLVEHLQRPTSASLLKQREKIDKVVSYVQSTNIPAPDEVGVSKKQEEVQSDIESEVSERNYYAEQETRQEDRYPPTPHQLYVYNKVVPDSDSEPPLLSTQCFQLNTPSINVPLLSTAVNKIAHTYKILTTKFYQNERIIDADVEAFIETSASAGSLPLDKFTLHHHSDATLTPAYIGSQLHGLLIQIKKTQKLETVFQCHIFTSSFTSTSFIGFIFSNTITDDTSTTFVTNEILSLYFTALSQTNPTSTSRIFELYETKEQHEDFTDFAYRLAAPSHNTASHWKNLCIETVQESMEGRERDEIESQRKGLLVECDSLRSQINTLTTKKAELEIELTTLRYQRRQIDVDNNGQVEVYVDPITNQVSEMSKSAKAAIIKVVLGVESTDNHSVANLLAKHDCTTEVQAKIGHMNLDQFSTLSDDDLQMLGLLSKDRRKILALSEYCRNRIRIKFALERKILKQQREYDMCSANLKAAQNSLDINDDMAIRLNHILNPPSFETKLLPLSLEGNTAKDLWTNEYNQTWGFVPFEIDAGVVQSLRTFIQGVKMQSRQQKKTNPAHARSSSVHSFSSSEDEEPLLQTSFSQSDLRPQNTKTCLLTAFAVMLKHISGHEKFLLGSHEPLRTHTTCLVGPLTDIVPIPFDFSSAKEATFNSLLSHVHRVLKSSAKVTETPFAKTAETLGIPTDFPVQFQYFPEKETHALRHAGLSTRDLLGMRVFAAHENKGEDVIVEMERLWSVNEGSQRGCEFKLTLVEDADEIVGVIQYRRALYDEEKVGKWVSKFVTTLEGIEYGPKKLQISQLISRYYSSVLLHNSLDDLQKHTSATRKSSLGSMHTLRDSQEYSSLPGPKGFGAGGDDTPQSTRRNSLFNM